MKRIDKVNYYNSYIKVILSKDNKKYEFVSIKEASETLGLKRDNITRAIKKGQKVSGYHAAGFKRKDMLTGKPKP